MSDEVISNLAIKTLEVDSSELIILTNDLVENSIGESGGFNAAKRLLKEELDNLDSTKMDDVQKAGVFAGFVKDVYLDINKQAMQMAFNILKTNEELTLSKYKTEVDYDKMRADIAMLQEQKEGIVKDNLLKEKELLVSDEKVAIARYDKLDKIAKLKKQMGVEPTTYTTRTITNGSYYSIYNGASYITDGGGNFLDSDGNATEDPEQYVRVVFDSVDVVSDVVGNTSTPGAIDKQIVGYDQVNRKDLIKTVNEVRGLLVNAQAEHIPTWMNTTVKELIKTVAKDDANVIAAVNSSTADDDLQ